MSSPEPYAHPSLADSSPTPTTDVVGMEGFLETLLLGRQSQAAREAERAQDAAPQPNPLVTPASDLRRQANLAAAHSIFSFSSAATWQSPTPGPSPPALPTPEDQPQLQYGIGHSMATIQLGTQLSARNVNRATIPVPEVAAYDGDEHHCAICANNNCAMRFVFTATVFRNKTIFKMYYPPLIRINHHHHVQIAES